MSAPKHRGGPVVHIRRDPTPPRHRVKLRTAKSKNQSRAINAKNDFIPGTASGQVKHHDVYRYTRKGTAFKTWLKELSK